MRTRFRTHITVCSATLTTLLAVCSATVMVRLAASPRSMWSEPTPAVRICLRFVAPSMTSLVT